MVRCPGRVKGVRVPSVSSRASEKTQQFQGAQNSIQGRIDRKFCHGYRRLNGDGGFGDKRLQHGILLYRVQSLRTEGFKVKSKGRSHISQGRLVSLAMAHDRTARKAKRIGNVPVRMFLNDNFEWQRHTVKMAGSQARCKSETAQVKSPYSTGSLDASCGTRIRNSVPCPISLSNVIVPRWAVITFFTIARPSPVPPRLP